jgi:uncharacterized iron-regulated membrane protein
MKAVGRKLHLWLGLSCGAVFVLLGLTGSAIAWFAELDRAFNPALMQVAPPEGMRAGAPWRVEPATVQRALERLERDAHYGRPTLLGFPEHAGDVFVAWYRPPAPPASPWTQEVTRQVMLDPATLAVTGERNWGEPGLARPQLMPTLFHVHRYLVAGESGKTIVGIAGLVMVALALSGLVLWWPKPNRAALWSAITVRHGGSWPRFHFRLHRAAGLFAVPVLLVLGFSGSYFNVPAWIVPAVDAVAPVTPAAKLRNRSEAGGQAISVAQAIASGQAAMPLARPSRLTLPPKPGLPYELRLRQPGELRHGDGATRIAIDSGDGAVLRVIDPQRARDGDRLVSWLFPLHSGEAFGTAGRVFISLFGLMPLLFFVTGVLVWAKRKTP